MILNRIFFFALFALRRRRRLRRYYAELTAWLEHPAPPDAGVRRGSRNGEWRVAVKNVFDAYRFFLRMPRPAVFSSKLGADALRCSVLLPDKRSRLVLSECMPYPLCGELARIRIEGPEAALKNFRICFMNDGTDSCAPGV